MKTNFKLSRVVQLGFGSVFVVIVIVGIVSKFTGDRLIESNQWVAHTYKVEADLRSLEKVLIDAETGQRGYLLTRKEEFLQPYYEAIKEFKTTFQAIHQLVQDNPAQVERLDQFRTQAQAKIENMEKTIALSRNRQYFQAIALVSSGQGKRMMDEIRQDLAKMIEVESQLLEVRKASADQAAKVSAIVTLGGIVATICFGLLVLWFIAREIIRPINQATNAIASSSNEIAATVEQQERTITQQAASVNETTTTMDELSASSQQSAQQAEAAAVSAQQVLSLAEGGNRSVAQTLQSMALLKAKVVTVADQIVRLSEQTNQIGNISTLVSDLANQTNMLALNAAVEAVRAGEHGKGFSVVASEIRKLADQSKKSAQQISQLVTDIQAAINATVLATDSSNQNAEQGERITQQTADAFANVSESVNNIVLNVQQISLNSKQQAIAIQQVVEAMTVLNRGAQETASGIRQTRAGTQQLNEAALNLQTIV
ncbi:CHASE3 domain-containing protein [Pantanalinema sp. GBBB05]|uniref:CHASE3 domain-containing protein n=1 Tax=Pantanalinema sp. GBBB05 TaxID=2604139 RepID=UPI001D8DB59C|nr:chemotaxis protein [Pantanalinema sp. GBBB05]